jgi:hypothetical protein
MKAFAIPILVASICALNGPAEDVPREPLPATGSPRTEIDEPALPAPERGPVDSSPDLLPESNELPEPVPAQLPSNRKAIATPEKENIEERQFEKVRLQAMNNPHAAYLLRRAKRSLRSATRRSYLRAYYLNVTERMRELDPKLKSSIDAYEQAKIQQIDGQSVSQHASSRRTVNRRSSRKIHYANRRSHPHHHYYKRIMVIEDPYGPDYIPYYGPPVVFYPW